MAEIPAGRRAIVKGELLFRGVKRCRRHLWSAMTGASGTVVACTLCGKIKAGESMPADSEPIK